MRSLRSNLSRNASALSEKTARYGVLPHALFITLMVPQLTKTNRQVIELLEPRVRDLSASLYAPISRGDTRERERRGTLER